MSRTPDQLRATLHASALLSTRKDLDYLQRASIVSRVPAFDPDFLEGLQSALRSAVEASGFSGEPMDNEFPDRVSNIVEQWLERGVFVIRSRDHLGADIQMNEYAPVLFARGDESLIEGPVAAILNSRKPRRISPDHRWVRTTLGQVKLAAQQDYAIVTSYGSGPYDLVAAAALRRACPVIVVCPEILPSMASAEKEAEFAATHGELFNADRSLFLSPFPPGLMPAAHVRLRVRDRIVAALAQFLLIAEIRDEGTMTKILEETHQAKRRVGVFLPAVADDQTSGNARAIEIVPTSKVEVLSDESIRNCGNTARPEPRTSRSVAKQGALVLNPVEKGRFLIHYTRSCPGPWPGQNLADYYQALIDNRPGAEHSAFDTLQRMLSEGLVRGTSTFVRGTTPVVSFTECTPYEIHELVRWRKGLIRWNFEPYGIAIDRRLLVSLGAEPVVYGDEEVFKRLPSDRQHLFQVRSSGNNDWSVEKEWRMQGDLRLDGIPQTHITLVVPSLEEARRIHWDSGLSVTLAGLPAAKKF